MPPEVDRDVSALIRDCWASDPDQRPSFACIVDALKRMNFRVLPGVNAVKVIAFVAQIEEWEEQRAECGWAGADSSSRAQ
jgi:hypothetical protein